MYPPLAAGGFNTGGLGDLRLQHHGLAAGGHRQRRIRAEPARQRHAAAGAAFDPTDPNTFNQATSLTLFDSLGATHTGTMYFVKTATANQWDARLYIDGTAVGGAQTLQYSDTGLLTAPAGGQLPFPAYTPTTGAAAHERDRRPGASPRSTAATSR